MLSAFLQESPEFFPRSPGEIYTIFLRIIERTPGTISEGIPEEVSDKIFEEFMKKPLNGFPKESL